MVFSLIVFLFLFIIILIKVNQGNGESKVISQATEITTNESNTNAGSKNDFIPIGDSKLRNPFQYSLLSRDKIADKQEILIKDVKSGEVDKEKIFLVGILESEKKRIAIIQYKAKSAVYQENENIGSYKVKKINHTSVLLDGANGEISLKVMQ